jgi:hypothetical protein
MPNGMSNHSEYLTVDSLRQLQIYIDDQHQALQRAEQRARDNQAMFEQNCNGVVQQAQQNREPELTRTPPSRIEDSEFGLGYVPRRTGHGLEPPRWGYDYGTTYSRQRDTVSTINPKNVKPRSPEELETGFAKFVKRIEGRKDGVKS